MRDSKLAWDAGFYQGVLAAIHVCDTHGEQSLVEEIARGVGADQLIEAAKKDENGLDVEILKRNGVMT